MSHRRSRLRASAWGLLGLLLAAQGCAGAQARPPESNPVARASTPAQPARPPDPSEEITPEELATIPEPVQPAAGPTQTQAPEAARSPSRGPAAPNSDDSSQVVWRVQIFASQDLQLADRKSKEAAERLQVRAYLEFEAPYYKVRLGDFPTEEKAQALREQAISAGYPGAFRARCTRDITQDGQ